MNITKYFTTGIPYQMTSLPASPYFLAMVSMAEIAAVFLIFIIVLLFFYRKQKFLVEQLKKNNRYYQYCLRKKQDTEENALAIISEQNTELNQDSDIKEFLSLAMNETYERYLELNEEDEDIQLIPHNSIEEQVLALRYMFLDAEIRSLMMHENPVLFWQLIHASLQKIVFTYINHFNETLEDDEEEDLLGESIDINFKTDDSDAQEEINRLQKILKSDARRIKRLQKFKSLYLGLQKSVKDIQTKGNDFKQTKESDDQSTDDIESLKKQLEFYQKNYSKLDDILPDELPTDSDDNNFNSDDENENLKQLNESNEKRISTLEKFKQRYLDLQSSLQDIQNNGSILHQQILDASSSLGADEVFQQQLDNYHENYQGLEQLLSGNEIPNKTATNNFQENNENKSEQSKSSSENSADMQNIVNTQHDLIAELKQQLSEELGDDSVLNDLQEKLESLEKTLKESETCIDILEQDSDSSQQEIFKLKYEIEGLNISNEELQSNVDNLKGEVDGKHSVSSQVIASLEKENKENAKTIKELQKSLTESSNKKPRRDRSAKRKENELISLKNELSKMEGQMSSLKAEKNDGTDNKKLLKQRENEIESLKNELETMEEEMISLATDDVEVVNASGESVDNDDVSNAESKQLIKQQEQEILSLKNELNTVEEQMMSFMTAPQPDSEDKKAIKEKDKTITSLKSEMIDLKQQVKTLQNAAKKALGNDSSHVKTEKTMKKQVSKLTGENKRLKTAIQQITRQSSTQSSKEIQQKDAKIEQLNGELAQMEQMLSMLEQDDQNSAPTEQLEAKDKEINQLKHELEQMEEMIITMGEDDTPETNTANPKKKGTEDDYSDLFGS